MALERLEQGSDVSGIAGDRRFDKLVLRLEVVVDVADGNVRRSRDIGDRRLLDALVVDHLARTRHEALTLSGSHSRGGVTHLTNRSPTPRRSWPTGTAQRAHAAHQCAPRGSQ